MRRFLLFVTVVAFLSGCGGGGGGGGGGASGSGGSSVSLNRGSVFFDSQRTAPLPPEQTVQISWSDAQVFKVLAGAPAGQTIPSWLQLSLSSGPSPMTLTLQVTRTDLAAGEHTATVRVATEDASGNLLAFRDIAVSYTITDNFQASRDQLNFSYNIGSAAIPDADVTIYGPSVSWNASADQPWVMLSQSSGVSPTTINVTIDSANVPPGANVSTITVQDAGNASSSFDITLSLDVTVPQIIAPATIGRTIMNGGPVGWVHIDVELDNRQDTVWTATPSDPWILVEELTTGSREFRVSYDPSAGPLASGDHAGDITFSTVFQGYPLSTTVPVTLTLTPATLTVRPVDLQFQGTSANSFVPMSVAFFINTGSFEHPWSVSTTTSTGTGWILPLETSGVVSERDDGTFRVTVDPASLADDQYSGTVDVAVQINGDTLIESLPLSMLLEPRRLFAADNGVALVSTPSKSRLGASVAVTDNRDVATPWTASSDQPWPAGLAAETIHYATITLTSSDPAIVNSGDETIRVGLYVSDVAPYADWSISGLPRRSRESSGLTADTIRPYVYVTDGRSEIDAYNIYTGELVAEFNNVGVELRNMAVSSDGSTLYVLDYRGGQIQTVDLDAEPIALGPAWADEAYSSCPCGSSVDYATLEYLRLDGKEVLIGGGRDIIDAQTGVHITAALGSGTALSFMDLGVHTVSSGDGAIMIVADIECCSSDLSRLLWKYSALDDIFAGIETHTRRLSGMARFIASDPWADVVYRWCDYETGDTATISGSDLTILNQTLDPDAVPGHFEDGLLFCFRDQSASNDNRPDFWTLDPTTNTILGEFDVPDFIDPRSFEVSSDGHWVITKSDDGQNLNFTAID